MCRMWRTRLAVVYPNANRDILGRPFCSGLNLDYLGRGIMFQVLGVWAWAVERVGRAPCTSTVFRSKGSSSAAYKMQTCRLLCGRQPRRRRFNCWFGSNQPRVRRSSPRSYRPHVPCIDGRRRSPHFQTTCSAKLMRAVPRLLRDPNKGKQDLLCFVARLGGRGWRCTTTAWLLTSFSFPHPIDRKRRDF